MAQGIKELTGAAERGAGAKKYRVFCIIPKIV